MATKKTLRLALESLGVTAATFEGIGDVHA